MFVKFKKRQILFDHKATPAEQQLYTVSGLSQQNEAEIQQLIDVIKKHSGSIQSITFGVAVEKSEELSNNLGSLENYKEALDESEL